MSSYDKDKLRELLKDANELASEVPEESRKEILERLVDHMLSSVHPAPSSNHLQVTKQPVQPTSVAEPKASSSRQGWEEAIFNGLPEPHTVADGNRQAQTIWAVIYLVKNNELATVAFVRATTKDLLGISPQSENNTSTALKDLVPRYLTRAKEGRGYTYRPTRHALEVFAETE